MVPLDSPPAGGLPVWLGALGPRMLALAGRIADGVILNLMTLAEAGQAAGAVRDAARAAGRDPASVEVACVVHCCLSGDAAAAAGAARAVAPRYALHPAVPQLFGELDGGAELGGVRERVLAGDRAARPAWFRSRWPTGSWRRAAPLRSPRGWRSTGPPGWTCRSSSRCPSAATGVTSRPLPRWQFLEEALPSARKPSSSSASSPLWRPADIGTLREIYAPDALIWHNDDLLEQSVEDNLKVLQGLHRAVSGLRYDIVRRAAAADGVLQQHVLRGQLPNGAEVELHAAMYLQVRDGHITRIEEYLDSARRAEIRKAREALSG